MYRTQGWKTRPPHLSSDKKKTKQNQKPPSFLRQKKPPKQTTFFKVNEGRSKQVKEPKNLWLPSYFKQNLKCQPFNLFLDSFQLYKQCYCTGNYFCTHYFSYGTSCSLGFCQSCPSITASNKSTHNCNNSLLTVCYTSINLPNKSLLLLKCAVTECHTERNCPGSQCYVSNEACQEIFKSHFIFKFKNNN